MGAAESLFEEILAGQYSRIAAFLAQPRAEENVYLEFKRSFTPDGVPSNADLANYSKALSGFANSDGGVVVWGISCPKPKSESAPDIAESLMPIPGYRVFQTTLNSRARILVHRPVDGIRNEAIADPTSENAGFVVSLIPASEIGPHRCEFGDDKGRHYKRNASNFILMENFEIEDMFGRRRRPKLAIDWAVNGSPSGGQEEYDLQVFLTVQNIGNHPALHVAVATKPGCRLVWSEARDSSRGADNVFVAKHVLHPGTSARIATASRRWRPTDGAEGPLTIEATAYALDAAPSQFKWDLWRQDLEPSCSQLPARAFLKITRG